MARRPAALHTPLHSLFAQHAAERPERSALTLDGVDTSYRQLNALADEYAAALPLLGARPGDRVVVYADISVDVVAAVLGILKAGCCVATTHQTFARGKLVHQIGETEAAVLVTDRAEDLGDLFADTDLDAVIPLNGGEPLRRPRPMGRVRRGAGIPVAGPLAAVFYTTGSSADPKGVAISHANMSAAFTAVTGYLANTADDAVLSFTPIGADFGFYNIMMPLAFGGRAVLHRHLSHRPEQIIETINRDGVTAVHAFPSLLAPLCASESLGRYAIPSLRYLCSTGQRLPAGHIAALRSAFPTLRIHSMYGLTECKRVCGLPPEEIDRRPGSVGRPIPGVRVTLVDGAGEPVTEPDNVGELAVSGDLVMQGYWRRPELTAQVLRTDPSGGRTFLTGDLFTRDRDGYLYWVGRKDDAFTRTLLQVDPHEIEALLRGHPEVVDAVVVPVPDERSGNVPAACIVLRERSAARADELRDFCAERLDWHMVPAAFAFYDELPRTASGKPDRIALRHALARESHLMDGAERERAMTAEGITAPGATPCGAGRPEYVTASSMIGLADRFDAIATGRDQVPRVPVRSTIRDSIHDRRLLDYQDAMVETSGPLFQHFLASVPGILEEMSRVGIALSRLAERRSAVESRDFTFYEADAFDGTNGRTLAAFSQGRVKTLTSSPNKANEPWFHRYAEPRVSRYFPGSLFHLTSRTLHERDEYAPFRDGVDFLYETAAFQFYGKERAAQIRHIADLLRPDGLAFFLEKLNHPDPQEYGRRERAKDEVHKAAYFTPEDIERKRQQMLLRMTDGQVEFDELVAALEDRFNHVHVIWHATNFYEFVASDDAGVLAEFLELAGGPFIPDEFLFDDPAPRRVGGRQRERTV